MSKLDDAYSRIGRFESCLKYTTGSFISALRGAYGADDVNGPEFTDAVDMLCADLRAMMVGVEDRDDYRERLHDLVMIDGEEAAIGGGPSFKDRRDKAWDRAREPFEP